MRPSRNPPAPPAAAVAKNRRGQQWPHPEAGPSIYAHAIPFQAQASHNPTALACPGPETVFAPAHFQDLDVVSAPFPWPSAPPRPAVADASCGPCFIPAYAGKRFDDAGFLYLYGPPSSVPAPSIISSRSSTTSPGSSASSTLSTICTDWQQQQQQAHVQPHQQNSTCGPTSWAYEHDSDGNTTSTLPSPTDAASEGTIRPWENDIVGTSDRTEAPGGARPRVANIEPSASGSHICLWGMDGPCKDGPFTTREALNWHVKAAHLLTCPVLGCTEGAFAAKKLVEVHLRWQHKLFTSPKDQELHQSSDLLNETAEQTPMAAEAPSTAPAPPRQPKCEDKRLKMELTVATSKKRCRDQLRAVVERRCKRVAATPRSMDSPGTISASTPRAGGAVPFPVIWEHGVLPFLIELMPKWCGAGHVITVTRGKKREARRVCIMTTRPISKARKVVIAGHVRDLLPDNYKGLVSFVFSVGAVERLTWARGLSKDMPDEICQPRNPFCYVSPQMGDSIGMTLPDGDDTSATLGPCIKIGGAWFWLANFHPFEEVDLTRHCAIVEHPSPEDRDRCVREKHDALEGPGVDLHLGQLTATSGYDLKTTRITHEPYWEDCDKEPPLVVTDWALISSQKQQANMMRKFPSTATPQREEPITRMCSVAPGAEVCATGRTSGYQRGLICEIPAYIDGRKNGTGKATREWFIEEPFECEDEDSWIRGGIGVAGDSGAGVVDCDTNALVGQLWGRNKYFGPGPRVAFFTPIFDVFDDIQERCGQQTRPQLPQNIQEAERWPAYPVCRPCFDVQEYMATRRSSRESLVSMIPAVEISGDADHELRTISELATPRDSSFGSVVSPAPVMSTFFYQPHVPSPRPGIFEITSPYAMDIRDEDLEDGIGDSPYAGLGKRQSGSAALVRSSSQQSAKRRRIM